MTEWAGNSRERSWTSWIVRAASCRCARRTSKAEIGGGRVGVGRPLGFGVPASSAAQSWYRSENPRLRKGVVVQALREAMKEIHSNRRTGVGNCRTQLTYLDYLTGFPRIQLLSFVPSPSSYPSCKYPSFWCLVLWSSCLLERLALYLSSEMVPVISLTPPSSPPSSSTSRPDFALQDVVTTIRSARRIVVICGAGVSTAASIPDFRSADGLFGGERKGKGKAGVKDLFHVKCLTVRLLCVPNYPCMKLRGIS